MAGLWWPCTCCGHSVPLVQIIIHMQRIYVLLTFSYPCTQSHLTPPILLIHTWEQVPGVLHSSISRWQVLVILTACTYKITFTHVVPAHLVPLTALAVEPILSIHTVLVQMYHHPAMAVSHHILPGHSHHCQSGTHSHHSYLVAHLAMLRSHSYNHTLAQCQCTSSHLHSQIGSQGYTWAQVWLKMNVETTCLGHQIFTAILLIAMIIAISSTRALEMSLNALSAGASELIFCTACLFPT